MRTLIDHIMCPGDKVKAYVQTSIKDFKADFDGSFTYIASDISRVFPKQYPGYQRYRASGRDMSNKCGSKRRVAASASGLCQHKKGRKENRVDISNTSRYYSTYEWNKLSCTTKSKLFSYPNSIAEKEKISTSDKRYQQM